MPAFEPADATLPPAALWLPAEAAELRFDAVAATFETPEMLAARWPEASEPAFELEPAYEPERVAAEDALAAIFGAISKMNCNSARNGTKF